MKNLSFKLLIILTITSHVYSQEREYCDLACDQSNNLNQPLKDYFKNGNKEILNLFLPDFKNRFFAGWSSSMLKATGIAPKIIPTKDEEDYDSINYCNWACMYCAKSAFDNDSSTAWSEGVYGDGIGEILIVPIQLESKIKIWGGFGKSNELFYANNRPKKIKIYFLVTNDVDGVSGGCGSMPIFKGLKLLTQQEYELKDINNFQEITLPTLAMNLNSKYKHNFIAIEIIEVYKGTKYNDTCISEIN